MTTPFPEPIFDLDGSHLKNLNFGEITVGTGPNDGIWGHTNALNIQPNEKIASVIDKIATYLEDVSINNNNNPVNSVWSSTIPLQTYQAVSAMTGVLQTCVDSSKPQTDTFSVFYSNGGVLTVIFTGASGGSTTVTHTLTNNQFESINNTGVFALHTILTDSLQAGVYQLGMFLGGTSLSVPSLNAGPSVFSYQLKYLPNTLTTALAGPVLSFSVDNPAAPSAAVSGIYGITGIITNHHRSGIPVGATGDTVTCQFRVMNAIKSHYNPSHIAKIYGPNVHAPVLFPAPSFVPVPDPVSSSNGTVSVGGITNNNPVISGSFVLGAADFYDNTTMLSVLVDAVNSRGDIATTNMMASGLNWIYIDSVSVQPSTNSFTNETYIAGAWNRVDAGVGMYPSLGPGAGTFQDAPFDSTRDLSTTYEAVLVNGAYGWCNYNFSSSLNGGPDYSHLQPDPATGAAALRWVCFSKTVSVPFTRTDILLHPGATSTVWSSQDPSTDSPFLANVAVFATIRNGPANVNWFDCNKAGLLPTATGDGCLDVAASTLTKKTIIWGSPYWARTGTIFIRIGLPAGYTVSGIETLMNV